MTIAELVQKGGFVNDQTIEDVIKERRLQLLIVRCITPAQDVKHFMRIIERDGNDYIRDVSIYQPRSTH